MSAQECLRKIVRYAVSTHSQPDLGRRRGRMVVGRGHRRRDRRLSMELRRLLRLHLEESIKQASVFFQNQYVSDAFFA